MNAKYFSVMLPVSWFFRRPLKDDAIAVLARDHQNLRQSV